MPNTHSLDLELDSDQYAYVNDTASLSITGDISIECQIKRETIGATQYFVTKWHDVADDRSYIFYALAANTLVFRYYITSANFTTITSDAAVLPDAGVWYHIAVAMDVSAKTGVLYVDGSPVASTVTEGGAGATSIRDSNARFVIGALLSTGAYTVISPFDGLIDDVRVWSDIRTGQEISDNYQKELVGNEASLQGYWKLNNDYLDETTNNNDLTAVGSPVFSIDVPFGVQDEGIHARKANPIQFYGGFDPKSY